MKSTLRTLFGLAPLGLVIWGAAASAQTTSEETAGTAAEPAATEVAAPEYAVPEPTVETPLAMVGDIPLTLGEVIAIRRELPQQYQNLPDEVLLTGLVEQLVDQMLLANAAEKAGLGDRPATALNLLNQRRAILADVYLRSEISRRVTQEAIVALYTERYVDAEPEREVLAAHILVDSEDTAKDLKAQLDEGADFAVLAAEHGSDGTSQNGGTLGWFVHSDMVPEFADAAFAMEAGAVSEPVQTSFGWHLIKLDDSRQRQAPPMEEVREALTAELIEQVQIDVLEELRAETEINFIEAPVPPASIRDNAMLDNAE